MKANLLNINVKNFSVFTIISLLALIAGITFYLYWGSRYGVWFDIGSYSITIVLILSGVAGTLLSLIGKNE